MHEYINKVMANPERLVEFTTDPPTPEGFGLKFTQTAHDRIEYSDESSEAMGHDVALELIDTLQPRDSVGVLTGAVSLLLLSSIPGEGLQPLRSEPFMCGVVRAIDEKNAWYSRKGPKSPLC
jgi:hypothetical protein